MTDGILLSIEKLNLDPQHDYICNHMAIYTGTILSFIQRGIPSYTDHGVLHTRRVIGYIRQICDGYSSHITSEDKMLLALAAILHDIGCIGGRINHSDRSLFIMSMNDFSNLRNLLTQECYRYLKTIIKYHSSEHNLLDLKRDETDDSRLAKLCCLFRLADECDISSERIPLLAFNVLDSLGELDEDARNVWLSHLDVEKVTIDGVTVFVQIYDSASGNHWVDKIDTEINKINEVLASHGFNQFELKLREVPRPD